jgi:hypothetical protein
MRHAKIVRTTLKSFAAKISGIEFSGASEKLATVRHFPLPHFHCSLYFHCVAKFKRPQRRAAGVAIYKNDKDTTNIVSSQMDVIFSNSQLYGFNKSSIGEICVAKCEAEN